MTSLKFVNLQNLKYFKLIISSAVAADSAATGCKTVNVRLMWMYACSISDQTHYESNIVSKNQSQTNVARDTMPTQQSLSHP